MQVEWGSRRGSMMCQTSPGGVEGGMGRWGDGGVGSRHDVLHITTLGGEERRRGGEGLGGRPKSGRTPYTSKPKT